MSFIGRIFNGAIRAVSAPLNIFKTGINNGSPSHSPSKLHYYIVFFSEYVNHTLCRTHIDDFRAVENDSYTHFIFYWIFQDKDLSIHENS